MDILLYKSKRKQGVIANADRKCVLAKRVSLLRHSRRLSVIPAKAGIQTIAARLVTRNQVQTAASGSPLPLYPVIPAKAGIHKSANNLAIRNQVQIAASGSPLPLYPVIPAKAGIHKSANNLAIRNQASNAAGGSPLPLWERARVRVSRAQARLCGRDARAPRAARTASATSGFPLSRE